MALVTRAAADGFQEPNAKAGPAKRGFFGLLGRLLYLPTNCRGIKSPSELCGRNNAQQNFDKYGPLCQYYADDVIFCYLSIAAMPPPLAFLLCLIFVVFLLRLDHKLSREVSSYLWIPSIWALVAFTRPLGAWFAGRAPQGTMESGSSIDRTFLIALLCLAVLLLFKRRFDWSGAIKENTWLIFLVGFMLISISWSSMPYISFKRWTRELIAVIMAFTVLSERNPQQAVLTILRRVSYICIPFSLVLIKYYPIAGIAYGRWSGTRTWIGVATQKNGLTRLCIIAALFFAWTLIRRWQGRDIPVVKYQTSMDIVLILLAFLLLMGPNMTLTYSATSTATFSVAMLALCGLYWMKKRGSEINANTLKAMIVIIVVIGTITPFVGKLPVFDISSVLKRDATLTDRNLIWERLVPLALDRRVLGHGHGGFWTTEMRALTDANAHNGYLDVILNIGFLGLLLILAFLLSCCRKAHRAITYDFEWGVLFVCYLLMLAIFNIAESSIDSLTASLPAIVMFFSVSSMKVSH